MLMEHHKSTDTRSQATHISLTEEPSPGAPANKSSSPYLLPKLGNGTGCPGVFQGNPCPYPSEPVPVHKGTGFDTYGSWVGYNPWVSKPVWDQNAGLHVYHKKGYLM